MDHYKHSIEPTSGLVPYALNARTHDDNQIKQIAASIKEFGFTNPVLIDDDGGIVAGHGRILAAQLIGLGDVPCITLTGLTQAQKKAYIIADNQLPLNAGWDMALLKIEIEALGELDFDIDLLGFDDFDFLNVDFSAVDENEQGRLDTLDPIYKTCPNCGKEFDTRES